MSMYQTKVFVCMIISIWMLYLLIAQRENEKELLPIPKKLSKKWIVITSVQEPTKDVKRLASLHDWALVVVGDTKTPSHWSLPGVHFLSVEYQNHSGFGIVDKLPYQSYTRKNIGYLYAIQHGAEWIYDTDDDNKPYSKGLEQFDYKDDVAGIRFQLPDQGNFSTRERLFNQYRFFGRKDMWPRGFPLEYLEEHTHNEHFFRSCAHQRRPAVQQGLVVKDPDVDAIYRLLHADRSNGLSVSFNKFAPPVIMAPGTYSPWNSQNTLFHKSAFHTLFLPTTIAFRATDIWRSFFAQKILHLAGDSVSFVPPNAVQQRNAHSYLKDFEDESDVYLKAGEIIEFLSTWDCGEEMNRCMRILAREFTSRGYWEKEDERLLSLWIEDLITIGHKLPNVTKQTDEYLLNQKEGRFDNCRPVHLDIAQDPLPENMEERAGNAITNYGQLGEWCGAASERNTNNTAAPLFPLRFPDSAHLAKILANKTELRRNQDTVLIVTNNYAWSHGIGHLRRLYEQFFGTIIFCGHYEKEKIDVAVDDNFLPQNGTFNYVFVSEKENPAGYLGYYCLLKVAELRLQNVQGYYMISDDLVFNFWNRDLDTNRVNTWILESRLGIHWNKDEGLPAAKRAVNLVTKKYRNVLRIQEMKKMYEKGLRQQNYPKQTGYRFNTTDFETQLTNKEGIAVSDMVYVPSDVLPYFTSLMEIFYEAGFFHELAMSKFFYTLPVKYHTCKCIYKYNADRKKWANFYDEELVSLHPVKLSLLQKPAEKHKYCSTILSAFHLNLFTEYEMRDTMKCKTKP